jgi:cytochrome P450
MAIKECMRHALPSFGSLRKVTEDDVLEGVPVRKGDAVLLDYRALHFSTEYWGPNPCIFSCLSLQVRSHPP